MSSSAITGPILSDVRRSPSGSAAAPSWSFADATGTGVYLASTDVLALSTAGVQRMSIDADGSLSATSDATIAAAFTGTNASNTTELLVKSAGGVGINTRARVIAGYNAGGSNYGGYLAFNTTSTQNVNAERARIDASGSLLVGTTNPSSARLVVASSGTTSATYCFLMQNPNGGVLAATDNGTIYTGTLSGSPYNLGTGTAANLVVFASGGLGRSTSALKYKKDIEDLPYGLDAILGMKPIQYKSKCEIDAPDQKFIGFIADWEKQRLPELVTHNEEGEVEDFAYSRLTAVMVKAMQELKAELDEAKAKIAALEAK